MPIITPPRGPAGATFNGGTITNPLVVNPANQTLDGIVEIADAASRADGSHIPLSVQDEFGDYLFSADQYGGISVRGDIWGAGSFVRVGAGRKFQVLDSAGASMAESDDTTGSLSVKGVLLTKATAAPADAFLAAGQVALWFDATNGAAKLMIKGKSANGTVVTGSVSLI